MILPDRMFFAAWIHDRRLRRLPPQVQLLLIYLRPLCDRNGRFEFNPALIHMALYASANCGNVSARDVEAWLEHLRSGGLIKSYTGADGRRVGEVATEYWRQGLKYGKAVYEPEAEQPHLDLSVVDPPAKRKAKRGVGEHPPSHHISSHHSPKEPVTLDESGAPETEAAWLARLQDEWPSIDIAAQLAKAHRKRQGDVERGWFEKSWLPNVTPTAAHPSSVLRPPSPEPAGWRQALDQVRPGHTYTGDWSGLPEALRHEVEIARRNLAA